MAKATKVNPHTGSSFDDFLKEDGIYEEVQARALKRALAEQLDDAMQSGKLSKVNMAQRMATSRSQLDRVLDPSNLSIQLDTLVKAASAVGRTVEIRLKRDTKLYMGEPGLTQDITANTSTNALRAETTSWAMPTRLTSGSKPNEPCPPATSHSSVYCTSLMRNAPTRLDRSHADHGGTTRRSGNSSQSVTANTNWPKGW